MSTETLQPSAVIAPDWSEQSDKVSCPLCDYDLRGLHDPRCPECGYQFQWDELLDPTKRPHPFLFEHYPNRNFWSFRKTSFATSFRPTKFWSSLLPSQPSVPRRLVLYWFLQGLILAAFFVAYFGWSCKQIYGMQLSTRASIQAWIQQNPKAYQTAIAHFGSKEAYLDWEAPLPPSWRFFVQTYQYVPANRVLAEWIWVLLAWPWLSALALLLYRMSMRQAKIRPIHVLRCTIYGSGSSILLVGAIVFVLALALLFVYPPLWRFINEEWAGLIGLIAMGVALIYRLSRAYRHYLRFSQATIAVALSQIVVILAIAQFIIMCFGYPTLQEMLLVQ